jgi:hypothetical protein
MLVILARDIVSMNRRTDRRTALLIDAAIHAAAVHGAVGAARELAERGVPLEVAMRVLTRPSERRSYSWGRGAEREKESQD